MVTGAHLRGGGHVGALCNQLHPGLHQLLSVGLLDLVLGRAGQRNVKLGVNPPRALTLKKLACSRQEMVTMSGSTMEVASPVLFRGMEE